MFLLKYACVLWIFSIKQILYVYFVKEGPYHERWTEEDDFIEEMLMYSIAEGGLFEADALRKLKGTVAWDGFLPF